MNCDAICKQLLKFLGGKENVINSEACMTRLRVDVHDLSRVDIDAIKKVEGVLGVIEGDTLQIVFGPGKVNEVHEAFSQLLGGTDPSVYDVAKENKTAQKAKHDKPVQRFLKRIGDIFVPLLPGIVACGLINGITNVIKVASGGAFSGLWWYESIRTMGWAVFTYLPIFVGYTAAKEFGGSPVLGGIAGAICISNPSMPLLATYGNSQIILPMTGQPYNPAHGGLIAAFIAGAAFAFLEKKIRKIMPKMIDTFISPLLVLIIGVVAIVAIIQPLSAVLTKGIYNVIEFVYGKTGFIGGYILSAGFLPLVATGLHQALIPIHAMLNDPSGPTGGINYLLPILMMAGGGQVGSGFALYFKTKNKKLKGFIRDSIPVGILGVGEPLMYAVTLPLGKSFITACLGSGFGGVAASLFHIGAVAQGASGLFGLLIVEPGKQVQYVIAMLISYTAGFILTWFFGVDEKRINEVYGE
ncbi:PTS transporter subunit EIIC [Butyrivibrio sp. XPD2002]|uniref:PTS transporter subunit EIIC n=1 Tax=Butyrivibrio sp. XPD2002 TaxID=1280665 RepID=UPI000414920C|nr:PTS transporter subunit EIIC [Butyrivibrio sp. XPD2002]